MPPEELTDLDPKIAGIVERAVQRVREELLQKLQDTNAEVEALTRRVAPAVPAPAAEEAAEAIEPRAAEPEGLLTDVARAAARIDACRSQKEVLSALLAEAAGFASRAALFLTRPGAAQGWAGHGFGADEDGISALRLDYDESAPWSRLAAGRGTVRLSAEDCADLCREIDGSEPAQGLLVPFILGGRVAAGLYADRLAEDPPIPDAAIQLLTLIGAQTVQSLPLREQPATPTLRYVEEAPADEPGLPLWQAGAAAAAAGAAAAEPPTAPPAEIEELAEPEVAPEEAIELEEPVELEEEVDLEADLEEATVELEPAEVSGFEVELAEEATLPPVPEILESEEAEAELLSAPALDEAELEVEEPEVEEPPPLEPEPRRPAAPELTPAVSKPPAQPPAEPPAPVAAAPSEAPTVPPPAAPAGEKAEIQAGTEIAPPPDLEGPGWAFTTTRISREATDEAIHEEARRLARLLVTEIKLYNEEQVEEGRRNRDVYQRLKEDIDRSRQIFEERIDEKVRRTTDYFHEELVRVLCGGDPQVLGL